MRQKTTPRFVEEKTTEGNNHGCALFLTYVLGGVKRQAEVNA